MKRTSNVMMAVVVGVAMLSASGGTAAAAARPGYETYVVRSGDTLGKISGRVFGDVKRWRELLKDNPQITNANRIFPGDTLLVPVPGTAGSAGELKAAAGSPQTVVTGAEALPVEVVAAPPAEPGVAGAAAGAEGAAGAGTSAAAAPAPELPLVPVEPQRPKQVINPAQYRSAGHITDRLPEIAIVAALDERLLLGTDDAAIVNAPIPPGTRFTVVRVNRRIYHPVTRKYLGWLVRVLGTAEVTCRDQRTSTVAMRAMNDYASVGDYLVPIDPNDVLERNQLPEKAAAACLPAGAGDPVIVAFDEAQNTIGERELAYIDRGRAAGIAPGQRFTIYHEIAPEGRVTVGELQVLRVGENTATALITNSLQELQVGYRLRAR
jgi:hypothetical protein